MKFQSQMSNVQGQKFGYTMIELMVTIGILALVTSIVLTNYPRMSDQLALARTAQEVALSLREARTYALAVRAYCPPAGGACSYEIGYGAHFDLSGSKDYLLFAAPLDADGNCIGNRCIYSSGYEIDSFSIKSGTIISKICDRSTAPPYDCNFDRLDVAFLRPDPRVGILGYFSGGDKQLTDVGIDLMAPNGSVKTVIVRNSGQISVE